MIRFSFRNYKNGLHYTKNKKKTFTIKQNLENGFHLTITTSYHFQFIIQKRSIIQF